MKRLFRKLRWIYRGRPMIHYPGFMCGCCGKWNSEPFDLPEYQSCGEWWDTIGVCRKCPREGGGG
jgi:hypothetical protein